MGEVTQRSPLHTKISVTGVLKSFFSLPEAPAQEQPILVLVNCSEDPSFGDSLNPLHSRGHMQGRGSTYGHIKLCGMDASS